MATHDLEMRLEQQMDLLAHFKLAQSLLER